MVQTRNDGGLDQVTLGVVKNSGLQPFWGQSWYASCWIGVGETWRLLAWVFGRKELPFTELGKNGKEPGWDGSERGSQKFSFWLVKLEMPLREQSRNAVVDDLSLGARLLQEIGAVNRTYLPHNRIAMRTKRITRWKYLARAHGSFSNVLVMNIFDEFLFSEKIHTQMKYHILECNGVHP